MALGDVAKLMGSGFHLAKTPAPFNELQTPTSVGFYNTQTPNTTEVRWKPVRGAVMYELEMATSGSNDWQRVSLTSRHEARAPSTTDGQENFFRVRALGRQAESGYSDVKAPAAA